MISLLALTLASQQPVDLVQLETLIAHDPAAAAPIVRRLVRAEDLARGANPVEQGTRVLFALSTDTPAREVLIRAGGADLARLTALEPTLFAAVRKLHDGDAFLASYQVDGRVHRAGVQLEVYEPNPFVQTPPGGMRGELRAMGEWRSTVYPNTIRKWYVYLPPNLDAAREYPLLVGQDAQWDRQWQANALENAAREGLIEPTVGVFIEPGQSQPGTYSNRSREYDPLSPDYTRFLLEEILPEVEKLVKLSKDPAKRAITGMSSGGICSFTACWERPDQFGVALSFIGSFSNIASGASRREGGHNYPFLIRKTDKKPIRVFLQDGENDLDNEHGNWYLCNLQMAASLRFKGYDHRWVSGKGFHNSKHARRIFEQALAWWQRPTSGE